MDHSFKLNIVSTSENEQCERTEIERLCGGTPEVLSILSGSIVKRQLRDGPARYSSGSYKELDVAGLVSGGKARVIAAAEVARFFPNVTILANGYTYANAPPDAQIVKEELRRYGASTHHVLLQKKSYSTFTELVELVKLVAEYKWRHLAIMTNCFQIPRAQELLKHIDSLHDPYGVSQDPDFRAALPTFVELAPRVVFVSAEAVLPWRSGRYQKIIRQAKGRPEWRERDAREARGLKQLQEGTYWNGMERKKKEPFRL
ncbi:MAG TPA: YdcF family protein [Terriglobales bacterium]|nr:YdcF family protein [Terriglobales bacterium]